MILDFFQRLDYYRNCFDSKNKFHKINIFSINRNRSSIDFQNPKWFAEEIVVENPKS